MNHLILLVICILSIELLIRSNIYQILKQIVDLIRRVLNVIKSSKISDFDVSCTTGLISALVIVERTMMIEIVFKITAFQNR